VANRQSIVRDAAQLGDWLLRDVGRELRVARLLSGGTQREVGERLGRSASHVSRVERGRIRSFGLRDLSKHAAIVGLKPWIGLYPRGPRPLDHAQLALLNRFRTRIAPTWRVELEVTVPIRGDLRAADALLAAPASAAWSRS